MQTHYKIYPIGTIEKKENGMAIRLEPEFVAGLRNAEDFSHLQVAWWAHLADGDESRKTLVLGKLFKKGPESSGIFATRAPARPNPIMISTVKVLKVDKENGVIHIPFIDAEPGSPVLDLKPYYPMERVKNCTAPTWCSHWPQWAEDAATFDWREEMNLDN